MADPTLTFTTAGVSKEDINLGLGAASTRVDAAGTGTVAVTPFNASHLSVTAATTALLPGGLATTTDGAIADLAGAVGTGTGGNLTGDSTTVGDGSVIGIYKRMTGAKIVFKSLSAGTGITIADDVTTTALTGGSTFAGSAGSNDLTCTSGAFTTELIAGDSITVNGETEVVESITDNDNLVIVGTWAASFASQSAVRIHDQIDISASSTPPVYTSIEVDQAGADTYSLKLTDSTDVTHAFSLETGLSDTSVYGDFLKQAALDGGLSIRGVTDLTGTIGLHLQGLVGDPSGAGAIILNASRDDASGNAEAMTTTEKLAAIQNGGTEKWSIDSTGLTTQSGGAVLAGPLSGVTTVNASGLATVGTLNVNTYALTVGATSSINQDVSTTGAPSFNGLTIPTSYDITLTDAPVADTDAANKAYVDTVATGLEFQDSITSQIDFTSSEPGSPTTGDRYITTAGGNTSGTAQAVLANEILEWNGSSWNRTTATDGMSLWDTNLDSMYVFNSTSWVKLGTTVTHDNLSGVDSGTYRHLTATQVTDLTAQSAQLNTTGKPSFAGITLTGSTDITASDAAKTMTLIDNTSNALQIGSTGLAGLLAFDTTDGAETVDVAGDLDIASGKVLKLNGTAFTATANTWTAPQVETQLTITTSTTPTFDGSLGGTQYMTMHASGSTLSFSNITAGQTYVLEILQAATASTLTLSGATEASGDALTTTNSGYSIMTIFKVNAGTIYCSFKTIT